MAQAEASIIASNLAQLYAQQLDNIQSADVILKVLNDHENILVTKWDDISPIPTDRLLVTSGKHCSAERQAGLLVRVPPKIQVPDPQHYRFFNPQNQTRDCV